MRWLMRFLSSPSRRYALGILVVAAVAVPLPRLAPTIADAVNVIIREGDVQREDLYAVGSSVFIEGVVEGDLVVATGRLIVTGRIEGDITGVVHGRTEIFGQVDGSVRLAGRRVVVAPGGVVADDLAVTSPSVTVAGTVRRDVIATAGTLRISGAVGRDVRGQALNLVVEGTVERDLEVTVRRLGVSDGAVVSGDVVYRSGSEVRVGEGAAVAGSIVRVESSAPIWLRAARRAFGVVSVLAFLFTAIVAAWVFRRSSHLAVRAARGQPWQSPLIGLAVLVGLPLAAVLAGITLVGLPVAVVLALLWLAALFLGAAPALAAAGTRVLRGRGGLLGGFVVATVAWRALIWILPVGGFLVWAAATLWGTGAATIGVFGARRAWVPPDPDPLPVAAPEPPELGP